MEENRKDRIYKTVMLVFITFFITFTLASIFMYNRFSNNGDFIMLSDNKGDSVSAEIDKIRSIIDQKYLNSGEIDEEALIDGAVKGYVKALGDQYGSYMTEVEWETFQEEALGNYQGIGLYLTIDEENNEIIVMAPITESAADKAGIKSGDIIKKIDGVEYTGEQLDEAASAMKGGEVGGKVKLEVKRDKETLSFEVTREMVRMTPILTSMYENNIGYMQMTNFDERIGEDFVNKYNQLKKDGATSIILDVRFNGGGYISGAKDVLDALLPKDSVLFITSGTSGEIVEKAETKDVLDELPMVILQNEYSASATEILTGTLKEYGRATIVGDVSYGKGVLQSVYMVDGAALKLTTDEFFTAKRNRIQEVGIQPDYVVEIDKDIVDSFSIPRDKDKQLDKAIELLSKK